MSEPRFLLPDPFRMCSISHMGKRAGHYPVWTHTLAGMIEAAGQGYRVSVGCDRCTLWRVLDHVALTALAERVGPGYCLINRRTRCRLKKGCPGWNRFFFLHGRMCPLWDDATAIRWSVG